ncbi:IS21-like element helper ATPase IstB [Sporolactobacillus laevolacticus]|uniref:IS21-like element helper ATPase IstB n=1 Tax=Sporolactobacillus laevolacticus TaxID=33018 RepID=UPI003F49B03D
MMNQETTRKLYEMRLSAMVEALNAQETNENCRGMSFNDRFELLVDTAYAARQSNKLERLIKQAGFKTIEPSITNIDYLPDRHLDQQMITRLASGSYIKEHHNIIIMGASGNGKTWLATALGIEACRQFLRVKYVRLPELLDDLLIAKNEANGDFRRILERYRKIDLLIIDEWLLTDLSLEQSTFILELIERRLHRTSTIFCSQFEPKGWHSKLGNAQIADAILDRIVHDSYSIVIDGSKSMRERYGIGGAQ